MDHQKNSNQQVKNKYNIGDVVTSYANVSGEIVEMVFNEDINEWIYYCKDKIMVVKESNIKYEGTK